VGLGEFEAEDAEELIRYAVRRGLIGADEGDRVLGEVHDALGKRKPKPGKKVKPTAKRPAKKKPRR
jgi:uncharacterized OB-fold protein